jgi:hypothetical protein
VAQSGFSPLRLRIVAPAGAENLALGNLRPERKARLLP